MARILRTCIFARWYLWYGTCTTYWYWSIIPAKYRIYIDDLQYMVMSVGSINIVSPVDPDLSKLCIFSSTGRYRGHGHASRVLSDHLTDHLTGRTISRACFLHTLDVPKVWPT